MRQPLLCFHTYSVYLAIVVITIAVTAAVAVAVTAAVSAAVSATDALGIRAILVIAGLAVSAVPDNQQNPSDQRDHVEQIAPSGPSRIVKSSYRNCKLRH